MIMFCQTCRTSLVRHENGWKHRAGEPADGHVAQPLAARRYRLFDLDVIGLPGYDRVLGRLVERERAGEAPIETWRLGLYVFDGRVRGAFRYARAVGKIPSRSPFQPPHDPARALLRDHPIVKARLPGHGSPG